MPQVALEVTQKSKKGMSFGIDNGTVPCGPAQQAMVPFDLRPQANAARAATCRERKGSTGKSVAYRHDKPQQLGTPE